MKSLVRRSITYYEVAVIFSQYQYFCRFTAGAACASSSQVAFFGASDQEMPSLAPMLENVTPAVVNISVAGSREVRQRLPGALEQFLGRGGELRQEQPFRGLGSGVIIDAKKAM